MENVKFWFRRKTFPSVEDHGYLDVEIKGEGATIILYFRMETLKDLYVTHVIYFEIYIYIYTLLGERKEHWNYEKRSSNWKQSFEDRLLWLRMQQLTLIVWW
jgi:hypothetical protein